MATCNYSMIIIIMLKYNILGIEWCSFIAYSNNTVVVPYSGRCRVLK